MVRIFKFILSTLTFLVGASLFFWVTGFIVFCGTVSLMTEPQSPPALDAAIVLTGGTNRIDRGFDLLAGKKVNYLLVSGVHKDVKLGDLTAPRKDKKALPKDKITLGREAGNTIGNALEARTWIKKHDIKSVYVLTSNYHMTRALMEFRHALPDIILVPYPVEPQNFSPIARLYWKTSFIEYHKLLVSAYRILVYPDETRPLPPAMTE